MELTRRYIIPSFLRPSDATAYTAGDEISNNATAGSVVRPVLDLGPVRKARIVRAGCAVTPSAGNLVVAAFDFALLISKTADVVAAVGDNVALNITGAQRNAASKFTFANGAWTAPNGGVAAGTSGFQEVVPTFAVGASGAIPGNLFDFTGGALPLTSASTARQLTLVLQALAAWTPGAAVNTFDFVLDIEIEE